MKVPLSWLSEFIELPTKDPDELKAVIDMLGHEVEGYEVMNVNWSDVFVGEVVEITSHPDADKVRVCQVDIGEGQQQIICGAWNFEVGAKVAVAVPGAVLPGDLEIGQRSIRGVESHGMICSEAELGLGEDHAGILVLDGSPEVGRSFDELVDLPDVVFEISITPNRPDAMSMLGIARDLAAHYDIGHRIPELEMETVEGSTEIDVVVEDTLGCRRFTAREITEIYVGKSPLRIRHRLAKVGVRSISNVVDVTNYVMFELGHPLHAFDADKIDGDKLTVKRASDGETLVTLDGIERKLRSEDLIIYDELGPTSMSGTMGGERSEVSSETTNVLMEAASWDPPTIMTMSRGHGLISEASTRFERGVDPGLADIANQRASMMVANLAGGSVLAGGVDVTTDFSPAVITLTRRDVERLLGPGFEIGYIANILERLGMETPPSGDDEIDVVVPTYRPDVTRPADLVEEVARIHGFEKFGATVPTGPAGYLTSAQKRLRKLRDLLTGAGLHQAVNLPFVGEEDLARLGRDLKSQPVLRVRNPLRDEEGRLRNTMLPGLLNVARRNASHGERSVAVFETGLVFLDGPDEFDTRLPTQVDRLAWVVTGQVGPSEMGTSVFEADARYSFALARRLVESMNIPEVELRAASVPGLHPGRSANLTIAGESVGYVGELLPSVTQAFELKGRVAVAELDLKPLLAEVPLHEAFAPSAFPFAEFDLSFVVGPKVRVAELIEATVEAAEGLVESSRVFDEYRGDDLEEGHRAVAISYRLRSPSQTLSNEDVAPIRTKMIAAASELGATLRGAE